MRQIFTLLLLFTALGMHAQGLKRMGDGLKGKVLCTCTDSIGNIYAVTKVPSDSFIVNKWTVSTKKWAVYLRYGKALYSNLSYVRSTSCQILFGNFYMTIPHINSIMLLKYTGSKWDTITFFKRNSSVRMMNVGTFKNRLYFVGEFDSLSSAGANNVMVYNGSNIVNANFPNSYQKLTSFIPNYLDTLRDTLYITYQNKILFHKYPNIWGVHDSVKNKFNVFYSLTIKNDTIIATTTSNILYRFKNRKMIDSVILTNGSNNFVHAYKGRVLRLSDRGRISQIEKNISQTPLLQNETYTDSMNYTLMDVNNKLYYYGSQGVKFGGDDYNNIVELDLDSMPVPGQDTINVKIFRDVNKNLTLDTGDAQSQSIIRVNGRLDYNSDLQGNLVFYPLDNEDMKLTFIKESSFDSCYMSPFQGAVASTVFNSSKTSELIYFPLKRTSNTNRNITIKAFSRFNARLLDTVAFDISVRNDVCDNSNATATVKVALDKDFVFVSTSPAYTTFSGNVLTYFLATIKGNGELSKIKINGYYPNTKYTVGSKVKHTVRMTSTFADDTTDNTDSIVQHLVYSYDPNCKNSWPQGKVTAEVKKIRFYIDFQNEGNDDARRVTIVDTMDHKMPVYDYQMVGSTHPNYTVSCRGNVVTWVFDNINLKPKALDEAGSKGQISFDASVRSELRIGDSIRNRASIYFDYNDPVITDYAKVERIKENPGNGLIIQNKQVFIKLYPNPANDNFVIENNGPTEQSMFLYDINGRIISNLKILNGQQINVDCSGWAPGLYLGVSSSGEIIKLMVE
ncbi:MAG: T9SS type A sorting domain-containing protein [Bacteroidota bacterium]